MLKTHPPTFAAAVAAFLAALMADLRPVVMDAVPVLSETTVMLMLALVLGVLGGLIGKFAENYTMPWMEIADNREMEEIEFDDEELM